MNIFFLQGMYDGCYYYRGYLPAVYGEMYCSKDFIHSKFDENEMYKKSMEADVIVMQRPNTADRVKLAKLLKQKGKKVIFENDDTYLPDKGIPLNMLPNDNQREIAIKMNKNLYEVLKIADGVIASTETLAEEYREINNNVKVLKNCIDPLDEYPRERREGRFRIALIGSVSSNGDYEHIKDQLKKLDERNDIEIIVFGIKQHKTEKVCTGYSDDYEFWNSLKNVEWQTFVPMNEYYMTLANLNIDLAIIPRKESYFNRCKSNLKFLEMSLLKIPVLAQSFSDKTSPYDNESEYMELVGDNTQWYNKIVGIMNNYQTYQDRANKAYQYVIKNYNIVDYAKKWKSTIENICK